MSLLRPGVIKQHKRHFSVTCTVDVISFPQHNYSYSENNILRLLFIRWEDQSNHKQLSVTLWSVSDKATEHQLNVSSLNMFFLKFQLVILDDIEVIFELIVVSVSD